MSSLRNSLHRRNHKERSQPTSREKFDLLEKHKDYVLRARDYHSKQDRIRRLRQKASDRNKDEFYFGMNREKTRGGVHIKDRGNVAMATDMVKVLKTQDENYIRTMRASGSKKIEKLKAQITELADLLLPHLNNGSLEKEGVLEAAEIETLRKAGIISTPKSTLKRKRSTKHLVFVDSADEARNYVNLQRESEGTCSTTDKKAEEEVVDLGWKMAIKKKQKSDSQSKSGKEGSDEEQRSDVAKIHRTRLLKELAARLERDGQLRLAERELIMQRALMGKGGSLKLRGVEKVSGGDEEEEFNEDEMDSGKIKKSTMLAAKKNAVYRPKVYKWRLERRK